VANRRSFDTALATEWIRSPGQPMSVVMADIDHFKNYNDHHGHPAGDACLIEISRLLASSPRGADILCCYGGEEFTAILPRADLDMAVAVAERMRRTVENAALPHAPNIGTVTISVGVASALASRSIPANELLARADAALCEAKHAGRNCVRTRP
jgi:diguanylate cyclase (GGDEF)-like protein